MRLNSIGGRVVIGCFIAAAIAFAAFAIAGDVRAGSALAAGLALGSFNGAMVERAIGSGITAQRSSVLRLGLLTVAALGAAFILGLAYAWLIILGLGMAQGVLVAVAARSLLRR